MRTYRTLLKGARVARPKLGEGETQRLHVKISDEELEAIDDWRFANRVPSRSEAVRRLVQIALVIEGGMADLQSAAKRNGEAEKEYGASFNEWAPHRRDGDLDPSDPIDKRFIRAMLEAYTSRMALTLTLSSIVRPVNTIRGGDRDLDEALKGAKTTHEFFRDQAKKFLKAADEASE